MPLDCRADVEFEPAGQERVLSKALKVERLGDDPRSPRHKGLLASGVEIDCDVREIEHPEGRFMHKDGTRYDVCVMEIKSDPTLRPPALSRSNFVGDRADTERDVIRLGNVKQVSFRPLLVSPGTQIASAPPSIS